MGLPGAGKTTLSNVLTQRLHAVHFNADAVRANINKDLGFSEPDGVEQARRIGWLYNRVVETGGYAIADFICPTKETRAAFAAEREAFIIWMDRIQRGRFEDTNRLFEPPANYDLRMTAEGTPECWADQAARLLRPIFDNKMPTALFVSRYQPFHDGHKALIVEGIERVGQACIAVRDTSGLDGRNPYSFEDVHARIEHSLRAFEGKFTVVPLPNITNVYYGRDIGYTIERIDLDADLHDITATKERAKLVVRSG